MSSGALAAAGATGVLGMLSTRKLSLLRICCSRFSISANDGRVGGLCRQHSVMSCASERGHPSGIGGRLHQTGALV